MSKEEDRGLLSRMVRFVRNPTASWADLDQSDLDSESRYSKQMLKDMIERRRRNDFVRKREFDMLRKLRRDNVVGAQEGAAKPSFFPSSGHNKSDERAKTIKKIDEIEAQMSQQWWKTKHGESGGLDAAPDNPNTDFSVSFPDQLSQSDYQGGARSSRSASKRLLPSGKAAAAEANAGPTMESSFFESTEMQPMDAFKTSAKSVQVSQTRGLGGRFDGQVSDFNYSKLNAVQIAEFTHDPLLEEAAIRFANGDDDGAESALQEALRNPDPAINGNEAIWMTLFDLYRATDRQETFESVSLDFANRFGRTAPQWFSIPGSARLHTPVLHDSSIELEPHWKCPTKLALHSVAALHAVLERVGQPWCLNWSSLVEIDDDALAPLLRMLTQWTDQSVKLRFLGTATLLTVFKVGTVSGDRNVNTLWWRNRMQLLRIMHRPDEFEVVALDYCVTYEVSPPSWEVALCNFKSLDAGGSLLSAPPSIVAGSYHDGELSTLPADEFTEGERATLAALGGHVTAVDLSGHIMGDAVEMLDALNEKLEGSDLVVVLCARLIRLDFLAAGTLLNWVSARQAEGRKIQFKDLHRLVAVFFNIIGINEHAKVIVRTD